MTEQQDIERAKGYMYGVTQQCSLSIGELSNLFATERELHQAKIDNDTLTAERDDYLTRIQMVEEYKINDQLRTELATVGASLAAAKQGMTNEERRVSQFIDDIAKLQSENLALRSLVLNCQEDLAHWIVPDSGVTDHEVLNQLLSRLDGPQAREALSALPKGWDK